MLCQYMPELIGGVFTLIAAGFGVWLAAYLAVKGYFRQREHEMVLERYLVGGVDVVAAELDRAFEIYKHNSARCLAVLRIFRDMRLDFNPEELSKGFVEPRLSLPMVAHNRLGDLIGSQGIWHLYQAAMAFVTTANDRILNDHVETIRSNYNNAMADRGRIFNEILEDLRRLDTEREHFAIVSRVVHKIGQNFERQKELTFEKASQFSNDTNLQSLLAHLRRELQADLEDFAEPAEPA